MDSGYADVNTFILYLSDVFNTGLTDFELHYHDFNREDNEKIIDFYFRNSENKKSVRSLSLVGAHPNTSEDDELIDLILCRQDASCRLKLSMEHTSNFKFKTEYFRNTPILVELHDSSWISFDQFLEMESYTIALYRSTFKIPHFKLLIEKWNSGWTPKWRVIMVESSEEVNIDECVSELVALGRFSEVQVERSEVKDEYSDGEVSQRIIYKIHRSDKAVGQIIVENSFMFSLYVMIDSEKNSRLYPQLFLS
ncbi:hypothetical protein GCK72_016517 [Caenorhabditis remanei]|uniref:F-box associated domain-containing protein n=1 Tax=Caenorhabditis remanei TaxID=31234 RepID=A0A6A5G5G7_CAERE|nr:hypothetical protein GCK72_016517 [Caenorhabditis remanei]KAF1749972.1 hypothetical protein GCK72_016517 [Caenorhabditis remanei]